MMSGVMIDGGVPSIPVPVTSFPSASFSTPPRPLRVPGGGNDQDVAQSQYELARRHCTAGSGVALDINEAIRLLRSAAAMDHGEANHALGVALFGGNSTPTTTAPSTVTATTAEPTMPSSSFANEQQEGLHHLQRAIELGSQYAEYSLGYAYYTMGDYTKAASLLTQALNHSTQMARDSRGQSLALMATLCHRGQGTSRDDKRAVALLTQAIEIQPVYALQLGDMLREGPIMDYQLFNDTATSSIGSGSSSNGTVRGNPLKTSITDGGRERDNLAALGCFQKVVEHSDRGDLACRASAPLAQLALAKLYLEGAPGVSRNVSRAYDCVTKSAGSGVCPEAQFLQGMMLREGKGTDKNMAAGSELVRLAAIAGVTAAMTQYGLMYRDGCGVTKDRLEALKWLQRACDAGSVDGRYELAVLQGAAAIGRPVQKEGSLTKMGAIIKNWKARHFILDDSFLCYYKDKASVATTAPLGTIPVAGLVVLTTHDISGKKGAPFTVKALKETRVYTLLADTVEDRDQWLNAIRAAAAPIVTPSTSTATTSPVMSLMMVDSHGKTPLAFGNQLAVPRPLAVPLSSSFVHVSPSMIMTPAHSLRLGVTPAMSPTSMSMSAANEQKMLSPSSPMVDPFASPSSRTVSAVNAAGQQSPTSAGRLCDNECKQVAMIMCYDCKESLCHGCDATFHTRQHTANHKRVPLTMVVASLLADDNASQPGSRTASAATACILSRDQGSTTSTMSSSSWAASSHGGSHNSHSSATGAGLLMMPAHSFVTNDDS